MPKPTKANRPPLREAVLWMIETYYPEVTEEALAEALYEAGEDFAENHRMGPNSDFAWCSLNHAVEVLSLSDAHWGVIDAVREHVSDKVIRRRLRMPKDSEWPDC
jgi:hypothetical protein